jgi:LysM repeat protein
MKFNATIILTILAVGFLYSAAFAMGGPAVEPHNNTTAQIQPQTSEVHAVAVTGEIPASASDKAKDELASLEVQSEVFNGYLMVLNRKIIEAKKAGDTKKLAELSEMERAMSEKESNVVIKISGIMMDHPELNPAEISTVEAAETSEQAELKPSGKTTMEAAKKKEKPKQAAKTKAAGHIIVYYVVKKGETLKSIARKCMGSESFYKEIARLNGITKARQFKPGIRLKIYKHNAK